MKYATLIEYQKVSKTVGKNSCIISPIVKYVLAIIRVVGAVVLAASTAIATVALARLLLLVTVF